jgi:hypothetical protein
MKIKLATIIGGWIALLIPLNLAYAQAPSSIAGDGFLNSVTFGTYPFDSYGYVLFIPANSGNSYQVIRIDTVRNSSGTYTYTLTGSSTAIINVNVPSAGLGAMSASFANSDSGSLYVTANPYPGAYYTADFDFFSSSAPSSIAGKTIACTIRDGLSPFFSSGSYTFSAASSGNTYTIGGTETGTYSYSLVNRSIGKLQLNDSLFGIATFYVGFKNSSSGDFAITQPSSGGFQIGSFAVLDVTPPTVTITSPTAGQRWSNSVFTVTGKTSDDVQVAQVYYQIFGEGWNLATTSNGWTNWSGSITLTTPGTNIIQAYSVDTSGNSSSITNQSIVYVVTALATVQTNGNGIISPNYNGQQLEIGKNYSMTATAAAGFAFVNWTGSVNTSGATVSFTMQDNLVLTANFIDVTKPTLTITAPFAGQHMTNALATVVGTASDNWKVGGVWYQLNGGAWSLANTANGFTNWTQMVTLTIGTNILKAYALDWGGNFSTTNTLSVVSSNTFLLQLSFTNSVPLKTNGLVFSLQLSKGLNGHILVSSNLTSWATLTNFVGTNTTLNFRDSAATNSSRRFYRAVVP